MGSGSGGSTLSGSHRVPRQFRVLPSCRTAVPIHHVIWHVFVLVGAICHFFSVWSALFRSVPADACRPLALAWDGAGCGLLPFAATRTSRTPRCASPTSRPICRTCTKCPGLVPETRRGRCTSRCDRLSARTAVASSGRRSSDRALRSESVYADVTRLPLPVRIRKLAILHGPAAASGPKSAISA